MSETVSMIPYSHSGDIMRDMREIIDSSRKSAYQAVNIALVRRNWLLGRRIAEEAMEGKDRAAYGLEILKNLSAKLTEEYGKGFTKTNLYSFYSFYKMFPDIFRTVSGKSQPMLSWSHYETLLRVKDSKAREWYANEAAQQTWAVRTLRRNIDTQYYYRLLSSQNPASVESEMNHLTSTYQHDRLEYMKNPVIAEFLGLSSNLDMTETQLESAILSNLQKFLMELGKGYAFVARQQHIHTEKQDYYIDLVFYNYILKCFVLIDLKTGKITHQDVGQMDMYIRMYDELKLSEGDNPTLGIVLCSETDEDIARYSVLHGNEQLFASKYKLYLPTEEELRAEIEAQKEIFYLQQHTQIKPYRFYGWETADVTAGDGMTPRDLYDILSEIWCADTCAPRLRAGWSGSNKTLGQCSITAFLAQDLFGGKVYGIPREGGSYHCYNVVGDCVFDLTSEQFGDEKLCYENNPEQFRDIHFAKEEKRLRYEYLKAELLKKKPELAAWLA